MSNEDTKVVEYEMVYIIQPNLDEGGITDLNARIVDSIEAQDGTVVKTETWGRRGLAYPILKHIEAHYVLLHIDMPGSGVKSVEQTMRFSEDIMRFLVMHR